MTNFKNSDFLRSIIRQGDVLLLPIDNIPEGVTRVPLKTVILQESAASPNKHKFKQDANVSIYEIEKGEGLFAEKDKIVVAEEDVVLYHGTSYEASTNAHLPQKVPTGTYLVRIKTEYDYNRLEDRKVID